MVERLAHAITQHAAWVVAISLALTVASLARLIDGSAVADGEWSRALRLEIDPSMSSVLPDEDPARDYHERIRDIFGNDETLLLAVRHPRSIFEPEALAALQRTTEALEELGGIRDVMSLSNAANIRAVDGDLVVAPLFEQAPTEASEVERVRRELYANPVLAKSLVSDDGRATAIVGYLLDMSEFELISSEVDVRVLEIARREFGPEVELWLSGGAHIKAETQRILYSDLATVMPSIVVVLMVIAFLSFRTLRGVLIPILTLGLAIVWTLGLATFFLPSLNLVTVSVPAILMGVGFAYAVHVVSAYCDVVAERGGSEGAAAEALRRVGLATFLTCLTTAVGFFSIALSPIRAIQEFGLLCGIGVTCLLVTTWAFAPALLELLPDGRGRSRGRGSSDAGDGMAESSGASGGPTRRSDSIDRALRWLGRANFEYRRWVLGAGLGLALLSLAAVPWIEISTDVLDNFPDDLPVRRSIEAVNEHLGGADQVYVVLESEEKDAFKEPRALRRIAELQKWLEAQPEVGGTTSVADYVKLLHRAFNDDDPAFLSIPDSRRLVSQLLLFGANDDVKRLVNSQFRIARIPVRVSIFDSADVAGFADRIEQQLEGLPGEIEGRVTGLSVLVARTNDEIAYGQAVSLLSAFVIIYAILALLFTSPRVGLLAMIPNVLPVVIYFGALGWFGISLNVVTGLVACLVLGIAVDDTIHFLARFNVLARERANSQEGVRHALVEVGRAVTYTSAALCAGFLVLTASTLQQQVQFGALAAFTLAVAWLIDLTFTPALASGMRIVTLWELVSLDLGKDPTHSIGLFQGLRAPQARVVALMGTLVDAPAGRALFHAGEPANGLFVLISGSVRTWIDSGDRNLAVAHHQSGDTVGEVGLFHGEHHMNAEVEKDARLLRLRQSSMEELTKRYPRIAALVLRNATRLLASRLALQTKGLHLGEVFARSQADDASRTAGEVHLGDAELRASLASLGIHEQTQRALGLIPMVQVAWADGQLAAEERSAILVAADSLGLDRESHALLASWLVAPPDPELFGVWRDYVESMIPKLSVEGRLRLKEHVVGYARAVAQAAGGVAGLRSVSRHEQRVIMILETAFEEIVDGGGAGSSERDDPDEPGS